MLSVPDGFTKPSGEPVDASGFALEVDSPLAKALYRIWSGERLVVVSAVPGSGKTTLAANLATQIALRMKKSVLCATPHGSSVQAMSDMMNMNPTYREYEDNYLAALDSYSEMPGRGKRSDIWEQALGGFLGPPRWSAPTDSIVDITSIQEVDTYRGGDAVLIIDATPGLDWATVVGFLDSYQQVVVIDDPVLNPVVYPEIQHQGVAEYLLPVTEYCRRHDIEMVSMTHSYRLDTRMAERLSRIYHTTITAGETFPWSDLNFISTNRFDRKEAFRHIFSSVNWVLNNSDHQLEDIAIICDDPAELRHLRSIDEKDMPNIYPSEVCYSLTSPRVIAIEPSEQMRYVSPFYDPAFRFGLLASRHTKMFTWIGRDL